MNRNVKLGTRAAVAVSTLALVIGAGVGTANAAGNGGGGPKGAALSALVTAGTITEAQKEEFRYEMHEAKEAAEASGVKVECAVIEARVLSGLVSEGTLTQSQADAIKAARPARPERAASTTSATGTTGGARTTDATRTDGGPLAALVANGTITSAQADAIKAAHQDRPAGARNGGTRPAPVPAS
ncbi:MAG: hypothetical protein CK552_03510 [Actinobacteria bacterium]|nr:MAG: hypothetical protein CK552_03510 [Actinomycetota bacterium]